MDMFDYVIVGGGTAAGIIAYRLGEAGFSVCVLEAGSADNSPMMKIPAGFMKTLFNPRVTWQFTSEPMPTLGGRTMQYSQGRTLGGSSTINGMIYNRGQAGDFDGWAKLGNRGWGYQDILPYFRRSECRVGTGDDRYRGREGRHKVSTVHWPSELVDAFIAAAQERGNPFNPDYNGADQTGVGYYQSSIHRGRRVSGATAYLRPAARQFGVEIRTGAVASALLMDGKRVTGVSYTRGGAWHEVGARSEVIVAAGTINSPKLLQLSGIGPVGLLGDHGIAVRQALPGVGENFRDHYSPRLVFRARDGVETINARVNGLPLAGEVVKWLLGRPSVLGLSPALAHMFGKTDPSLDHPDYALVFMPASYKLGVVGKLDDSPGMTCGAWQMRPESRGHVRIKSADPMASPLVNANYLAEAEDRRILVKALRSARSVLEAPALAPFVAHELFPGQSVQSDDEWLSFARANGGTSYHLIGTCKMGPATDALAVVDDRLRVHGLSGLRVADASIMPTMPSANTAAATMMIAEKAADMIVEDAGRHARREAA